MIYLSVTKPDYELAPKGGCYRILDPTIAPVLAEPVFMPSREMFPPKFGLALFGSRALPDKLPLKVLEVTLG